MPKILTSYEDLILWILAVPGKLKKKYEPIIGRTRLVKTIFLFEKEVKPLFFKNKLTDEQVDEFEPLHFGPFDSKIYNAINFLCRYRLIKIKRISHNENAPEEEILEFEWDQDRVQIETLEEFDGRVERFEISDLGKRYIEGSDSDRLSNNQIELLTKLKERVNSISLKILLQYVYKNYPETITRSIIKEEILNGGKQAK